MTEPLSSTENKWRRRCWLVLAAWLLSTFLMSFEEVRAVVAWPLVVNDPAASGDAAYVMADGYAYMERLRMASDLYHMKRVPKIILLNEQQPAGYNFTRQRLETRVQRAIDYLELYGVPNEIIATVDVPPTTALGSRSEARAVASQYPELKRIVVVTSAPHTRRSRLCFRRACAEDVTVQVVAASGASESAEIDEPLWLEYCKLAIYYICA
ncbi:YdcF family protein [Roseimaritima ulvae]|uniref:DUF218 domain-containing protein n=1 Tax=Roseimaritima ulvae TaxID=980254 RepID=A0A5B9R7T8_9BACT|nr:YdcF family protein [Roseimaritima ulvae]QEG42533.1 hypothetical protein UC8_45730 [Roseimaritima ulvae]